jgi:hypothetical protein
MKIARAARRPGIPDWQMAAMAAALASAVSSAHAQLYARPITDFEKPYQMDGYTIFPPRGQGWFEMNRDRHFVYFGKRLSSPTHSLIAVALSSPVGTAFENVGAFREHVARQLAETTGDTRSKVTVSAVDVDPAAGPYCVRYQTRTEDRGAANAGGRTLLAETVGISCLHTDQNDLAVDVSYTERGLPGETGTRLRDEVELFIRSLKFVPRR